MNNKVKKFLSFFSRLSIQDKINFARHLGMVVKAGLPLHEGLSIIKKQSEVKFLQEIITHLMSEVNNGRSLADSLVTYRSAFGDFFINIIRVGEASGTLSQNLFYLADELKKAKNINGKVRSAMIYPAIIFIATIGLTSFLAFGIFPKLLPIFTSLNVELPASTKFLISIVNAVRGYGFFIITGIIAFIVAFQVALRTLPPFKYAIDRTILFLPVISNLVVGVQTANFTRVLGLLLKGGMNIVEAVEVTANTFDNLVYRRALKQANEEIKKGAQLAQYLNEHRALFPPLLSGMVKIGENTGNLEDNLFYLAEYYNEEVENTLHDLTSFLEPLMLLGMGLIIAFVALSIITPIYSISQNIK